MFGIVGERINTSRKKVMEAVVNRDAQYIREEVLKQEAAGATFIDVNAGACIGEEMASMEWLLSVIQEVATVPLCIDSPDPKVLEVACGMLKAAPLINSISLERERFKAMVPFLQGRECSIVALCMDDSGLPRDAREIIDRAGRLVAALEQIGMKRERIYVDFLVQPIGTNTLNGVMVMEAVRGIMEQIPGVHTICGLSNISFGLPQRKIINRSFLALMMASGLDTAILDPLDRGLMAVARTVAMLLGKDEYCTSYLKAVRAGEILA
jgi:cobalamin-dependent methionine synthase I